MTGIILRRKVLTTGRLFCFWKIPLFPTDRQRGRTQHRHPCLPYPTGRSTDLGVVAVVLEVARASLHVLEQCADAFRVALEHVVEQRHALAQEHLHEEPAVLCEQTPFSPKRV